MPKRHLGHDLLHLCDKRAADRIMLFWVAWFASFQAASRVLKVSEDLLVKTRIGSNHWYSVSPEHAQSVVIDASQQSSETFMDHEEYVKLCKWRSDLAPENRIPRHRYEEKMVHRRIDNAVALARAIQGSGKRGS